MTLQIQQKLKDIETQYGVTVLYACETGSRAWGFASPDSDYDVRMIYRHDLDWYLSLSEKKDSIEYMSDDGELDITGWDIRKSLKLMWKSNGALLERIQSPVVYSEVPGVQAVLNAYAQRCFVPVASMYHYLGMARNSFSEVEHRDQVKLKKLFYALRATLCCKWILEEDSVPPIVFDTMVGKLDFDHSLKGRIRELVQLKSGKNESYCHPAEAELNAFISVELDNATKAFDGLKGRKDPRVNLDELFRELLYIKK